MSQEKLIKKLAIFHHPLFQASCIRWSSLLGASPSSLNLLSFIEINLRIQKAMMAQFDFENALASALNDWLQEVESLSFDIPMSPIKPSRQKNKKEPDVIKLFEKMLHELPFEPSISEQEYLNVISENRAHEAFLYIKDHISLKGFGKFMFDLCYSWCEELDIELFSIFINALFFQVTELDLQGRRSFRKTDSVQQLSEKFISQHRMLKTHYTRYKRMDLYEFESLYEWNYLPARLDEMRQKAKGVFSICFPDSHTSDTYINELYDTAIAFIVDQDLTAPTTKHFTYYTSKKEPEPLPNSATSPISQQVIDMESSFNMGQQQASGRPQVRKRVLKKLAMPIFGRTIPKPPPEADNKTHTIKSITTFLDPTDEEASNLELLDINQGLGPIWENEPSDTNSMDGNQNYYLYGYEGLPHNLAPLDFIDTQPHRAESPGTIYTTVNSRRMSNIRDRSANRNRTAEVIDTKGLQHSGYSRPKLPPSVGSVHSESTKRSISALSRITDALNTLDRLPKVSDIINIYPLDLNRTQKGGHPRRPSIPRSRVPSKDMDIYTNSMTVSRGRSFKENSNTATRDLFWPGKAPLDKTMMSLESASGRRTSEFRGGDMEKDLSHCLPVIEGLMTMQMEAKRNGYSVFDKGDKSPRMLVEKGMQVRGGESTIGRPKERFNSQGKLRSGPEDGLSEYERELKDNFGVGDKEAFFEKMNMRLEKNKKRQERRAKSGLKRYRRDHTTEIDKKSRVFLGQKNRVLFKQVFT